MFQPLYMQLHAQEQVYPSLQQKLFNCSPMKSYDDEGFQQPQKPAESTQTKLTVFSQYLQTNTKENSHEKPQMVNFVPLNQKQLPQQRIRHNIFDQNPRVLQVTNNQLRNLTPELQPNGYGPTYSDPYKPLMHTPQRQPQPQTYYRQSVSPLRQPAYMPQTSSSLSPQPLSLMQTTKLPMQYLMPIHEINHMRKLSENLKPSYVKPSETQVPFHPTLVSNMSFSSRNQGQPFEKTDQPKRASGQPDDHMHQLMLQRHRQSAAEQQSRMQDLLPQFFQPPNRQQEQPTDLYQQTQSHYQFQSNTDSVHQLHRLPEPPKPTPPIDRHRINLYSQKLEHPQPEQGNNHESNNTSVSLSPKNVQQPLLKNPNYQRLQEELLKSQQRLKQLNELSAHYQQQRKQLSSISHKPQRYEIEPISTTYKSIKAVQHVPQIVQSPLKQECDTFDKLPTLQNEFDILSREQTQSEHIHFERKGL